MLYLVRSILGFSTKTKNDLVFSVYIYMVSRWLAIPAHNSLTNFLVQPFILYCLSLLYGFAL